MNRSWKEARIAIFDVETTGLDANKDRVIEFAALIVENLQPQAEFDVLINPGQQIEPIITEITKLTNYDLRARPPFGVIAGHTFELLQSVDYCAAYNAPFDIGFVSSELGRAGFAALQLREESVLDPLVWVRHFDRYVKGKGRHKLTTTCERHGIAGPANGLSAHRALFDCHLTLGVMRHFAQHLPDDTEYLLANQQAHRAKQQAEFAAYKARMAATKP